MTNIKDIVKKYLTPIKIALIVIGIVLSYINPNNSLNYLLIFVALPLNLIPCLEQLWLHEKTGDPEKDEPNNQLAMHYLTNTILILIAIFLPAHGLVKKVLVLLTLVYLGLEGIRHLIHSFFHKDTALKTSHFTKFILVAIILPILASIIANLIS